MMTYKHAVTIAMHTVLFSYTHVQIKFTYLYIMSALVFKVLSYFIMYINLVRSALHHLIMPYTQEEYAV